MTAERTASADHRIQTAVQEIKSLIRARYPAARFAAAPGYDPEGTYLDVTIAIDDVDDVLDLVRERLFEIQVLEGLPLYVIPLEPTGERQQARSSSQPA